jgi:hypothetical protein
MEPPVQIQIWLVCWSKGRRWVGRLLCGQDTDVPPILSLVLEKNDAVDQSEERIVLAAGHVFAGLMPSATLAN